MKPFALLLALTLPAAATNVVFMMADDLGYMDTGSNQRQRRVPYQPGATPENPDRTSTGGLKARSIAADGSPRSPVMARTFGPQ